MRTRILICFIFINAALFCQNWNVFNKAYRYNYKYNFSQLISNVLFVDSIKFSGTDTIYAMNRIGVECTGSCPTVTAPLSPTVNYLVPNMPQFLQRRIYKYPDGRVQLFDTTRIVIVPTCTLNQSWLFDSIYNKTALCVNISTVNVFGVTDSVKTIMIDGVDSLELSKSFGVLKFPDLYNKNKYFRLAGIENKNFYSIVALFGEKVPNAWDFYDFHVGDEICSTAYSYYLVGYNNSPSSCRYLNMKIRGKSFTDESYIYKLEKESYFRSSQTYQIYCGGPAQLYSHAVDSGTFVFSPIEYTYVPLYSPTIECNYLYPRKVFTPDNMQNSFYANVVRLSKDQNNVLYKHCGNINQIYPLTFNGYYYDFSLGIYSNSMLYDVEVVYGVGYGKIRSRFDLFEGGSSYSQCLSRNNNQNCNCFSSLGVGITENKEDKVNLFIYPNPASYFIQLSVPEKSSLEMSNSLGQVVFLGELEAGSKIDISQFPEGIYFLRLKNSSGSFPQKLLIQR